MPAFCWALGIFYGNDAFEWRLRVARFDLQFSGKMLTRLAIIGAVLSALLFPLRAATFLRDHERIKPIAAKINAVLPANQRLYAIDPYIQSFLIYVHSPITYLTSMDQLPPDAHYVLIQTKDRLKIEKDQIWLSRRPRLIEWTPRHRGQSAMLFEVQPL
jgi:hypothetical protein